VSMKVLKFVVMVLCFVWLSFLPGTIQDAGAQGTKALLLFGESDHKTFLGCLNCANISSVSVCNSVGKYGSSVAQDSIWNSVGRFGSSVSSVSPWNSVSSNAPIIVDSDGDSYGYFSTNTVHHDRTRIDWLLAVLDYYEKTNDLGTL
jgi:hypothetical protein